MALKKGNIGFPYANHSFVAQYPPRTANPIAPPRANETSALKRNLRKGHNTRSVADIPSA